MRPISLKIQKVIMFIPYVNILNLFFWLYNSVFYFKAKKTFARSLWILLSTLCPLMFFQLLVAEHFVSVGRIISYLNIYAIPLILSYRFIKYQIEMCVDLQTEVISKSPDVSATTFTKRTTMGVVIAIIIFAILYSISLVCFPTVNIVDSNGTEKNSLAAITTDEIQSTTNHYTAIKAYSSSSGSKSNIRGKLEEFDYDEYSFSSEKISGIKTIMATKVDCNELTLYIDSKLSAGNMGIYILIDGQYYDCVEPDQAKTIVLQDIANKTIVVKLAAESADLSVTLVRKYS